MKNIKSDQIQLELVSSDISIFQGFEGAERCTAILKGMVVLKIILVMT